VGLHDLLRRRPRRLLHEATLDDLNFMIGRRFYQPWGLVFGRQSIYDAGGGPVWYARPDDAVYRQIDPRTRARLGRPRGRYATFAGHFARLKAAGPHATAERLIELERLAAQAARRPAACTDVTVSFSRSISVRHAAIRDNERRGRLAGDLRAAACWAGQEILRRANRAAPGYLQAWAGVTRTGCHGTRVDGREPSGSSPPG
jgi:hypothetical protein